MRRFFVGALPLVALAALPLAALAALAAWLRISRRCVSQPPRPWPPASTYSRSVQPGKAHTVLFGGRDCLAGTSPRFRAAASSRRRRAARSLQHSGHQLGPCLPASLAEQPCVWHGRDAASLPDTTAAAAASLPDIFSPSAVRVVRLGFATRVIAELTRYPYQN